MSRSRRKTPILPVTSTRSERADKKWWHASWRGRADQALGLSIKQGQDDHLSSSENEITNTWCMSKDGKSFWSKRRQLEMAEWSSEHKGRNPQERASLKKRLLRKLLGK